MWFPTIVTMMIHLFLAGLVCWGVDEVNNTYTTYVFAGYILTLATLSVNSHYTLLAGLMYDRDDTLKALDERFNKEQG